MITSLLDRKIDKRPDKVRLQGRILFLTEDPELIKRQLAGEDLSWDNKNPANNPKLRDDISTDEITPAHYCFYFDETLGEIPYLGLKCGDVLPIGRSAVKKGGFVCAVSGKRRGKGSSREQSPYAEKQVGGPFAEGMVANVVCPEHLSSGLTLIGKSARVAEGASVGRNCRVDPEVTDAMWTASLEDGGCMASPPGATPSHGYDQPMAEVVKR